MKKLLIILLICLWPVIVSADCDLPDGTYDYGEWTITFYPPVVGPGVIGDAVVCDPGEWCVDYQYTVKGCQVIMFNDLDSFYLYQTANGDMLRSDYPPLLR